MADYDPTSDPTELLRRLRENGADDTAESLEQFVRSYRCPECGGTDARVGLATRPNQVEKLIAWCGPCTKAHQKEALDTLRRGHHHIPELTPIGLREEGVFGFVTLPLDSKTPDLPN